MGRKPREKIPEDIAARVMFDSDRTCCVCRETRKEVQIHHIDEDPSNNSPENLAVLCFEHHDETQRKGGFGRKLNATQVRLYRDDWHKRIAQRRDRLVALNKEQFEGFRPDIVQSSSSEDEREEGSFSSLERERVSEYQKNHGLFIVHYWRPSDDPKAGCEYCHPLTPAQFRSPERRQDRKRRVSARPQVLYRAEDHNRRD
jgi:hypothetical protein